VRWFIPTSRRCMSPSIGAFLANDGRPAGADRLGTPQQTRAQASRPARQTVTQNRFRN
jgi:hypothetical protein